MESLNQIHAILQERGERIDYLISQNRHEDALAICEELHEWIGELVNP